MACSLAVQRASSSWNVDRFLSTDSAFSTTPAVIATGRIAADEDVLGCWLTRILRLSHFSAFRQCFVDRHIGREGD